MSTINSRIQLNTSRISNVPFQTYEKDFTFIVNNTEFQTSKIIADLISPVICQMHAGDSLIDTFTIRTQNQGNFQHFLNLINFQQNLIPEEEIPFFVELIQILGISINDITDLNQINELNDQNIFDLTRRHEKWEVLYSDSFNRDIDYIASNFFKLCETNLDDMNTLLPATLERIISNDKLKLKSENQLFKFINQIYRNQIDLNYCNLYHYVLFSNVDEDSMTEFIQNFDFNDFDRETWNAISNRLKKPAITKCEEQNSRYEQANVKVFHPQYEDVFAGIINYLKVKSFGIENSINITASSFISGYPPINVVHFDSTDYFYSNNQPNDWICFDFKENCVVPSNYQIRSFGGGQNSNHPKSWVIEGSNDNNVWNTIDQQQNCTYLNDSYKTHIFKITNQTKFRYIRMRLTGPNWANNNYLRFNAFEIYGKLL